jgi:hypothetical protein
MSITQRRRASVRGERQAGLKKSGPVFRSLALTPDLTANRCLTDVTRDELGHLEHADLALAIENRSERVVGVDLSPFGFVLKAVFLDVVPKLLGQFGTR